MDRTPPSEGGDGSSILPKSTHEKRAQASGAFFMCVLGRNRTRMGSGGEPPNPSRVGEFLEPRVLREGASERPTFNSCFSFTEKNYLRRRILENPSPIKYKIAAFDKNKKMNNGIENPIIPSRISGHGMIASISE